MPGIRFNAFAAGFGLSGFTGQETDAESDLMFYDARYYDPTLGRFVSEDPIGFAALDTNLYRYTGNNPINYVDPTGHGKITVIIKKGGKIKKVMSKLDPDDI